MDSLLMVMEEDELRDSIYTDVASLKTTGGRIIVSVCDFTLYYTDGH